MTPEWKSFLEVVTPVAIAVVGWILRLIWGEIRQLRTDQREYVTKEMCRTHREAIQQQMASCADGRHKDSR